MEFYFFVVVFFADTREQWSAAATTFRLLASSKLTLGYVSTTTMHLGTLSHYDSLDI